MALSTNPYKGTRDFYPEDKRFQNYLFSVMRKVVERYGYQEYETPLIEPLEMYLAKTSSEIVNDQTYVFDDRGGRKVVIRPEMTPSVSRILAAKRQDLAYPLRWYCIANVWRYERPQKGRLREHWQLNVDLFGVAGIEGDHEIIAIADSILKAYGAKSSNYSIKVNSRKLINHILIDYLELEATQVSGLMKLIDHMHKIEYAEFATEVDMLINPSQREAGTGKKLLNLLKVNSIYDLPADLKSYESVANLQRLFTMLEKSKIKNFDFDITLMRGFDYYSDIVFEVYDTDPSNNRSMFGGGRYQGLVELFGARPVDSVGFGMGDVSLANFIEAHGLTPKLTLGVDLFVALAGDVYLKAQPLLKDIRGMGINIAVDSSGSKLDKQLKSASKQSYKFVLIIGEKELDSEQYTLKNLQTGEEEKHSIERIVSIVKDNRTSRKDGLLS
ncbi:MAG TPA: histidine--tRNA ligase [Candidatus Saccharimonadales bacterium]|nr:histidine--tRNA ligase [Candidatus Saccharimonadales bacterium]